MSGAPRTRYLDGLRGLAALQVILHHTYLTVYPLDQGVHPTGLTKLATSSMMLSGLGVTVFIVLSGYTLSMSAHRRGWALPDGPGPFLRRRARRLLPAYYVVLAVSIVLGLTVLSEETGAHWDISVPFTGLDVVGHALVAQDVIGQPYAINHPLWSIALTFHLYLLFPVLLACAVRWGIGRVAVWALAVTTPIAVAAFLNTGALLVLRQLHFVGVFAAGMATLAIVRAQGVVTIHGRERRPPWPALAIALFVVWAAAPLNHLNHVPFALAVCCLLVGLGTGRLTALRRLLEWRAVVWMGAVSLSLYLVHAPIVHGTWLTVLRPAGHGVGDIGTLLLLLPLAVGASLLGGWLFHRHVERPLAPGRAERDRRPEAVPVPERTG
ncbi:MAG: acyltransferase [Solirubrobacteraceae bacterium]|nr:acyltransferase [Solirubrobacteraceae bacterium]